MLLRIMNGFDGYGFAEANDEGQIIKIAVIESGRGNYSAGNFNAIIGCYPWTINEYGVYLYDWCVRRMESDGCHDACGGSYCLYQGFDILGVVLESHDAQEEAIAALKREEERERLKKEKEALTPFKRVKRYKHPIQTL